LAAGFWPKKLAFARKNNRFVPLEGLQTPSAPCSYPYGLESALKRRERRGRKDGEYR